MADTLYHSSQLLFFALSAGFLGWMMYENRPPLSQAQARPPLSRAQVRSPLDKRQQR